MGRLVDISTTIVHDGGLKPIVWPTRTVRDYFIYWVVLNRVRGCRMSGMDRGGCLSRLGAMACRGVMCWARIWIVFFANTVS